MSNLRFKVVEEAFKKRPVEVKTPSERPSEYFAKYVFNQEKMFKYLPLHTYQQLREVIEKGTPLPLAVANDVAQGMKRWAMDMGVTHCTHWFQPLTEGTAEKHDAFLEHDYKGGMVEDFSGKELVQQEPDASSFPNGGIRSTFEARGYSAWDPASPVFIIGDTLMIPTVFVSYTGEALDYKAPLKKALAAVDKAATAVCKYFDPAVTRVTANLGWEQEYFLVDEGLYAARPDLLLTGRTLMGHDSAKNQQMDDHYFGAIPGRVAEFMRDLEIQALELGIPCKTRHNEVAPNQFELAPIFEECNLAVDHNMLLMSLMRKIARKHGFRCLLHEKPFAGINGSGKHNNWSVAYGDVNLLNPGSDPHQNAIFLTTLCAVIEAVDKHADLIRASVATAGNDHRLGANEAPPAVISVYLGDQLADVVSQLEKGAPKSSKHAGTMKIGVDTLPTLPKDATDRNRTSPFAFTGNKFEFRAPGSSASCSAPNVILNTIVAEAMNRIAGELEKAGVVGKAAAGEHTAAFHDALQKILQDIVKTHKRIIFNGDGYKADWLAEAAKRGLPNTPTTPEALKAYTRKENVAIFEKAGVFSARELESRYEIAMEDYVTKVMIEANCALDIAKTLIIPAVKQEYRETIEAYNQTDASNVKNAVEVLREEVVTLGDGLAAAEAGAKALAQAIAKKDAAAALATMADLRKTVDALEGEVADDKWPLPKYREMLFVY